jgi:hypothetical protein
MSNTKMMDEGISEDGPNKSRKLMHLKSGSLRTRSARYKFTRQLLPMMHAWMEEDAGYKGTTDDDTSPPVGLTGKSDSG